MTITIESVSVPAYSSIGVLTGIDEEGNTVTLAVNHRPARSIGEALAYGELVEVEPEPWQVLSIRSPQDIRDERTHTRAMGGEL